MGVWITEQALEVIVTALQEAAEASLARVDGSWRQLHGLHDVRGPRW